MFGRPRTANALDAALLEAVTDAVPHGSASIESAWVKDARGWFVAVVPKRSGACPVAVGAVGRDAVRFTVGAGTTFEVYGVKRRNDLAQTRQLLDAIVAGQIEEFGRGRRTYVRIKLGKKTFEAGRRPLQLLPRRPRPTTYVPYV